MINLMNQFRRFTGKTSLIKDDRGLSTVEYVIILVLIAAAAVGTWSQFGTLITGKINAANTEITSGVVVKPAGDSNASNASNGATKDPI